MISKIIDADIKTIVVVGSLDGTNSVEVTNEWVKNLNLTKIDGNIKASREIYYRKESIFLRELAGNYMNYNEDGKLFSLITVYGAGHTLGMRQFKQANSIMGDFADYGRLK